MFDRVTTNQIYLRSQAGIQNSFSQLFRAQSILTTGSRINRPSDDPGGTRRIMALTSERESVARYQSNLDSVETQLLSASTTLTELSTTISRIREEAVRAANGINDPTALENVASLVDQLYRTALSAANGRAENRYLFAGTEVDSEPFSEETTADGLTRVVYNGNAVRSPIEIGPGISANLNVPGSDLLAAGTRGTTRFFGTTGAATGTGNDSASGRDILQVRHTGTFFGASPDANGRDAATGLQPGSGSIGTDNILGTGSSLVISTNAGGDGTVTLNGGGAVAFTGTETALLVTDDNGNQITIDVTGLTPSLAATTVAIDGRGTLSTDGGSTTVPIDFANGNQSVRDSFSGEIVYVDSTGIANTGDEELTFPGTFDLFSAMTALRDVLRDPTRSTQEIADEVRNRIDDLDLASRTVTTALGRVGGGLAQVDLMRERLGSLDVTLQSLRSDVQDADIAATISEVTRNQTIYETSLLLASRIRQTSLLNFL